MMTNSLAASVLTTFFANTPTWLGLHSTDPTAAGLAGGEISGGSYQRQQLTWTTPSNRTVSNTNTLTFLNLPAAPVHFFALWTQQTGGAINYVIPLAPTTLTFSSGGTLVIPLNDIVVQLQ